MIRHRATRMRLLAALVWLVLISPASSRPAHKKALADALGPFLHVKLNDCRTCHLAAKPGEEESETDKPHNAFGARLKAVRRELKKTELTVRLDAIAEEDADQDGVANLVELLAGHNPGEKDDRPTAAEIAEVNKKLPAFLKFRSAYPWRPFEVVQRPTPPQVKNAGWIRNPIDAFIAAGLIERGLKPRPEAPKHVLLRRLYFDLIGLPPTPEELNAFLADESSDAYEKVVDRLLASPRYGERWARHWMDVWRYSDVDGTGNQIFSQPHIWRWRDWIVESVNADKGYDRMIVEMLAGDEIAPEDPKTLAATGFLVRNYNQFYPQIFLQDMVEYSSQALLGVTLRCARCHDHMYDPILQKEYYQVQAIFKPLQVRIDQVPGADPKKDGLVRVFDGNPKAETYVLMRGDLGRPEKEAMSPGVPAALGGTFSKIDAVNLPLAAYAPEKRDFVIQQTIATSEAAIKTAVQTLDKLKVASAVSYLISNRPFAALGVFSIANRVAEGLSLTDIEVALAQSRHAALLATLRAENLEDAGKKESEDGKKAAIEAVLAQRKQSVLEARKALLVAQQGQRLALAKAKDDAAKKIEAAEKALAKAEMDEKAAPNVNYTKRTLKTYPTTSTGRRLALARWIAHPENPLTARVAVNHLWLRHFGQALAPRAFDLGRNSAAPTHPALLDWLAAEFMSPSVSASKADAWSMKALHRLMITSTAYRMASTPDADNAALDPDNKYYWRMPSRRLEAEVVRDAVFYVAGKLDLTMGGPDIDHAQGLTVPRRSLYFCHADDKQMEFLKIFDGASAIECYQRSESIVPQQALAMMNSDLTRSHARLIAQELAAKTANDSATFAKASFERLLSRHPSAEELEVCTSFLNNVGADLQAVARSRENLVHGLMNHYEFRTAR